jgi:twitching motility protein PilT
VELNELLKIIVAHSASDLHLVAGLPPMMRTNGFLEKIGENSLSSAEIIQMTKPLLPPHASLLSDKDLDVGVELGAIARFRLNLYHDRNGICAAFRLVPSVIKSFADLGLPPVVERILEMRRGLVLITGITGSGKSTTLASIIDRINTERQDHIITIEDPIEFVHKHKKSIVNQREIGVHASSFPEALRAALREDPNVIMVGELRDLETISMAVTAAETGHLVLGSIHTRGASQTIDRIIDIFPPHQQEQIRLQIAEVLEMAISQLLLRSRDGNARHLACEVMIGTNAIRQHIRLKRTFQIAGEIETGADLGMLTLEKSLQKLVLIGKISGDSAAPWKSDRNSSLDY